MRQQMHDDFKNQQLIQKMKQELVKDIKVSPAQVRKYFKDLPADSIPFVPTEVEVEILTMQPRIPLEEINRVKNQLREFTDRVNKGETSFGYFGFVFILRIRVQPVWVARWIISVEVCWILRLQM